ncbi:hypothetical protein Tco_0052122 [Tanacetum coccineum]
MTGYLDLEVEQSLLLLAVVEPYKMAENKQFQYAVKSLCRWLLGDHKQRVAFYEKKLAERDQQCLSLQPSHPQALTNLGNIYMEWYVSTYRLLYDILVEVVEHLFVKAVNVDEKDIN